MGPVGTGDWGLGLGLDNIFYSRALTKYEFDNKRIKELKCVFRIVRLVRDFFFFLQALVTIQEKYLRSLSDLDISNPDLRFKCRNQISED